MIREVKADLQLAVQENRRSQRAKRFSVSSTRSLGTSCVKLVRQFVGIAKILRIDLLGTGRVVEAEIVGRDLTPGLPVPDLDAILRSLVNLLGGDDIAAGIGGSTLCDPDLPVDLLGA